MAEIVDFPPSFNPLHADFTDPQNQAMGGLIALAAFGLIGVAAFMPVGAAIEAGIVYNGVTYYGVTEAQAAILDILVEGEMTGAGQATLEALAESWGLDGLGAVDAMLLLDQLNWELDWQDYYDYSGFLDDPAGADCWDNGGEPPNPDMCIG